MIPLDMAGSDGIIALFFCSNIPTVDSIVTRVKSYSGMQGVELFITTKVELGASFQTTNILNTNNS
jgi:hypothetical protein